MNMEPENKAKEPANRVPFFKLFSYADSFDKLLMVVGSVAAAANGFSTSFISVLLGESIDSFGNNTSNSHDLVHAVSKVCVKFVVLAALAGIAAFLQVACWMITGERQAARIRGLYLKGILNQDIAFFDKETNTGEILQRMSGDVVLIQDAIGEKVGKLIQLVSTFIAGFAIAFVRGWLLTFVMLSFIPPMVLAGAIGSLFVSRMAANKQQAYASAATVVEQTVGSIKTVASFTGEKHAVATYNRSLAPAYRSGVYEEFAVGLGLGMSKAIAFCSYALAIWFGGKLIVTEKKTGGEVLNVIMAVLTGAMSLGQASPCMAAIPAGQAAAYKMYKTITRKSSIDANDKLGKITDGIHGDIELKNVYFSYPTRPDERIINGLSLFIARGSSLALVGHSGSGKSTIISLIERFYEPQAGEVLIDGINLKKFQLKWIRAKIGLVSQEPVLFASSIKENIAYGKDGATDEEIRSAAKLANAAIFIDKLPAGLDTVVGERGTQLSGGQRQRVAIARAILKDPRILLLDEATSALDAESERIVQDALDKIMADRTTVIVAHRLNTIRNADMIAVLHGGNLVEKGTHTELIKDYNGAYRKLVSLQDLNGVAEQTTNSNELSDSTTDKRTPGQHIDSSESSVLNNEVWCSTSGRYSLAKEDREFKPAAGNKMASLEELKQPPEVGMMRVVCLNKPEAPVLALGALVSILSGAILPVFGVLLSFVIKTFFQPPDELRKNIRFWSLAFVVLGASELVASPMASFLFGVAGCSLIRRIRSMCFEKVVQMEVGWFDEPGHSTGLLGARLSTDVTSLRAFVGDALSSIVQVASSLVTALIFAFLGSWQLTLIIIAIIPLIGLNVYAQNKFLKGFSADAKIMYEEASQVANDAVGNIRTVASFCAEEKVMEMYKKKSKGPIKSGIRQGLISGIGFGVSSGILLLVIALIYYAGARLVESGKIVFSDVFRVFFAIMMAATGVSQLSSIAPNSSKAKSGIASIFDILDRKSKIDSSDESGITLENFTGEINIQHVRFRYPTRPDVCIFQDLCLTIQSGKTVALVGESGSGKSTVISLLQRFYNPDGGHITLDGEEIQNFQLKWLRRQMGLVSQEPVLFNDTIRANIAYGKEGDATEAEIIAAAELANSHNFISGLKQGYDTIVGERGIQLSGGQKQRVAIARVVLKSPKIVLLDEATSALDTESERVIQDALDTVTNDRTTLVVAHRLSTIKRADLIAVLREGVIVEEGKHEDLVNIKDGFYASLVALQMNT